MEQSLWPGGARGQVEIQRATTLHHEKAVIGPLCTGSHTCLRLLQAYFLMDVLLPPEILANWLQPGALVAGAVGGMELLIGAFRHLRSDLKGEMHAGEARVNKRIDEVKGEMKDSRSK